jgi:hypothetical protein
MKALREVYRALGTSDNFDAAVIHKTKRGRVRIDKTYEAGKRHDALKGLGFGLAAGLAATLFPPVGIGAALTGSFGGNLTFAGPCRAPQWPSLEQPLDLFQPALSIAIEVTACHDNCAYSVEKSSTF